MPAEKINKYNLNQSQKLNKYNLNQSQKLQMWPLFGNHQKQVERIQKHFITCNLKVKTTFLYEILLVEVGSYPLEVVTLVQMISSGNTSLAQVDHRGKNCEAEKHMDEAK